MNASPILAWLEFSDGRLFNLMGAATVGRASENVVVLTDDQISRRHAIMQSQGE